MKYAIIQSYDIEQMMGRVCKASDDGWELYGNIVVTHIPRQGGTDGGAGWGGKNLMHTQTMIKREKALDYSGD